jgi:hypothetical protein
MRRMDDRRPLAQTPRRREELDRAHAVLGEAFLHLARLLVRVDVQREPLIGGVPSDLLEPRPGAGADGVGGEAHGDASSPELLDLREVRRHGGLAHAFEPPARVRHMETDEPDLRLGGGLRGGDRRLEPEVVELPDGRVAGRAHLPVRAQVQLPHRPRGAQPLSIRRATQVGAPAARPRRARKGGCGASTKPVR